MGELNMSCVDIQQNLYESLGDRDWDVYLPDEHHLLKRYIGYSMFGAPEVITKNAGQMGYKNAKHVEKIDLIYNLILKNHYIEDRELIMVRVIYILCEKINDKESISQSPVFVVKKCCADDLKVNRSSFAFDHCCVFIDDLGRVYQSWTEYLEDNKLHKCMMYCPINGKYTGQIVDPNQTEDDCQMRVLLEIHESPACSVGNAILKVTDITGTVVSVGSTVAFIGAAVPGIVVAPAVLATAGVAALGVGCYTVGRSIADLVNRGTHDQSLTDSGARNSWFGLAIGVLGTSATAATGLLTRAVSNGAKIGMGAEISFNTMIAINCVGTTAGLIHSGYNIYEKVRDEEPISPLEIFQFTTSIFFFYKSTVNFKTANSIISDTQSTTLQNYEKTLRSNRHRKLFRKAQLESRRNFGEKMGNAEILSGIRKIDNPDNYFAGLAKINKDLNKNGARYVITADGKVQINNVYIIDPVEFSSVSRGDRADILSSLPKPSTVTMTVTSLKFETSVLNNFVKDLVVSLKEIGVGIGMDITNCSKEIVLLLKEFQQGSKEALIQILVKFMELVTDNIVRVFKKLFPVFTLPLTILQFIIAMLRKFSIDYGIPFNLYLQQYFNEDGSVNMNSVNMLLKKFVIWLMTQELNSENENVSTNFNAGNKIRKSCKVCSGIYFLRK